MPANILITGASGFLGRALCRMLPGAVAVGSETFDLTLPDAARAMLRQHRPDVVVHLAARVGGIAANVGAPLDFLVTNLRIDANLLAALGEVGCGHFLPMLSTCAYPDALPPERYPLTEADLHAGPPPPTNASYAMAKRVLLTGAQALLAQRKVGFTALIPTNLYGPGDHFGAADSHFVAAAFDRLERGRREGAAAVEFFGTGAARRQQLFVEDLASLIALLAQRPPLNRALNVAPEEDHSIAELACAIAHACSFTGEVRFSGEGPDGQLRKDVSSSALGAAVPEWSSIQTPLSQGLSRTVEWYRAHVATG